MDETAMRIESLKLHREWVSVLAGWHFAQWGTLTGAETLPQYTALLERSLGSPPIPVVLVAFSGTELFGSVNLVTCDMTIRPALTPWVAQLFVAPPYRSQGSGAALVRAAVTHARSRGFRRVYLYTSGTLPQFYQRLGWTLCERLDYLGKERAVMSYAANAGA